METKEQDRLFTEAMDSWAQAEEALHRHNAELIDKLEEEFGGSVKDDFQSMIEDLDIDGRIEFVESPQGDSQSEDDIGIFKNVHVDQWTIGMEGDSFSGHIYAELSEKRWIKIPYSC